VRSPPMFGSKHYSSTRAENKFVAEILHRAEVTLTATANSRSESEGSLNEKEEGAAAQPRSTLYLIIWLALASTLSSHPQIERTSAKESTAHSESDPVLVGSGDIASCDDLARRLRYGQTDPKDIRDGVCRRQSRLSGQLG